MRITRNSQIQNNQKNYRNYEGLYEQQELNNFFFTPTCLLLSCADITLVSVKFGTPILLANLCYLKSYLR